MPHMKFAVLLVLIWSSAVVAQPGGARTSNDNDRGNAGRAGDSVHFTLKPPPQPGTQAVVSVKLGKAQSSQIAEDLSVTAVATEGKLELVARNMVVAELFHRGTAPAGQAEVVTRGLGRSSGADSTTPKGDAWKYEVMIDEFNEIRLADGTRSAGVHATLRVLDADGKEQYTRSYFDPPQSEWRTPEQISQQIAKHIDRAKTDAMMKGIASDLIGVFGEDAKMQGKQSIDQGIAKNLGIAEKLKSNLASNASRVDIRDYQFQEAAVRKAVLGLMEKAPAPGQLGDIEVRSRFMPMRKSRDAYQQGLAHFASDNLEEVLALWSSADEEPSQHRNLGLVKLRLAGDVARRTPERARILLDEAEAHLAKAKLTPKRDDTLLTAPAAFRRALANQQVLSSEGAEAPSAPELPALTTPPSGRHALLVGVGTFLQEEGNGWKLNKLPAAAKDVALLKKTLIKLDFPAENIVTLVDQAATQGNIEKQIYEVGRKVGPDDLFVFSIATHGLPPDVANSQGAEGYAYCYDSNLSQVRDTTLPFWLLVALLNNDIPCRRKIVLQDTCHAGAQYQGNPVFRMRVPEYAPYFALLAACDESQTAAEAIGGNGLFTKAVVDFWSRQKGKASVGDLANFVQAEVPKVAKRLGHTQTPVVFLGPGAAGLPLR